MHTVSKNALKRFIVNFTKRSCISQILSCWFNGKAMELLLFTFTQIVFLLVLVENVLTECISDAIFWFGGTDRLRNSSAVFLTSLDRFALVTSFCGWLNIVLSLIPSIFLCAILHKEKSTWMFAKSLGNHIVLFLRCNASSRSVTF